MSPFLGDDGDGRSSSSSSSMRESRRLHQAGRKAVETPRSAGYGGLDDVNAETASSLRARVAALEGDREMRVKLEKLLEVQTVQLDLQKELRVKTESLLKAEQQTTSKLHQQVDTLRKAPLPSATGGGVVVAGGGDVKAERQQPAEELYRQARDRIRSLERRLAEATAPETGDRVESHLRAQLEEQERLIRHLQGQMDSKEQSALPASEVVRLQLLLQSRDRHVDELAASMRKAQNDTSQIQSEADVLKHQVRALKKEVAERTEVIEEQLNTERKLRGDLFQLQARLEHVQSQHQEQAQRADKLAEVASLACERQQKAVQLEQQLAEEQAASRRERDRLTAEHEHRANAKEQSIKHQTGLIAQLNTELKEKQAEVDKLMKLGPDASFPPHAVEAAGLADRDRGGLLSPFRPSSPRTEDVHGQRSLESLHRQLKSKDHKIAKQTERLKTLTEMLEKRDQQLEELASARRDREQMRQRVVEMEEVFKAQPRVASHAEAERRLIEQEERLQQTVRQQRGLEDRAQRELEKNSFLEGELASLRCATAEMAASAGDLERENERLSEELGEARRRLEGRSAEVAMLRAQRPPLEAEAPPPRHTALPAMKRRLRLLQKADEQLGKDVAEWLQEREATIDGLRSTIALLRKSLSEAKEASIPSPTVPSPERGLRAAETTAPTPAVDLSAYATPKPGPEETTSQIEPGQQGDVLADPSGTAAGVLQWSASALRPHEIRHSMFLVLEGRHVHQLDRPALEEGLAQHFAIGRQRVKVVEDTFLPDAGGDDLQQAMQDQMFDDHSSVSLMSSAQNAGDLQDGGGQGGADGYPDEGAPTKRHLLLVNIASGGAGEDEDTTPSAISASDVLDQVRKNILCGIGIGPVGGVSIDAVFFNHGDLAPPVEWPSAESRLLLRESRAFAGRHAVVTVHEISDPYILRVVAFDTEAGREFMLFLTARDVTLLLDTRDSEKLTEGGHGHARPHFEGPLAAHFRHVSSVADAHLLDIIVSSLSFSVWQGQQILVASEMRIPVGHRTIQTSSSRTVPERDISNDLADLRACEMAAVPTRAAQLALLPEDGCAHTARPRKTEARKLFEEDKVLGNV